MTSAVRRGDGRGRTLGMPTANLEPEPEKLIPADGVYAVSAAFCAGARRGVMSIGARPTFDRPRAIEVHLLDYDGDLYGQTLEITFLRRLRDICAFPTAELLLTRIREDIMAARAL